MAFRCRIPARVLLALAAALLSLLAAAAAEGRCTFTDSARQAQYDLRPLARPGGGYSVPGHDTGFNFTVNVCGPLPGHSADRVGVRWSRGEHGGTLGVLNTTLHLRGDKLTLTYADGDACPQLPQLRQSAVVSFVCDQEMAGTGHPVFVAEWALCAFMFEWRTPAACPVPILADEASELGGEREAGESGSGDGAREEEASHGAVAFVAVFVVGSVYILGGVLYNRVLNTSSHLRGIEQLPNYRLWRGIFVAAKRVGVAAADGVFYAVDAVSGRRGAIRIDEAEHNIRSELFDMDDDEQDMLPIVRR
ncbi:Cation-independent mannose-6-phosphate receptor CI-MPR [Coemansia helicoidea]|uniref:Cation-independent mannose-6-phosphate receptor CI-MPR n=1 Tax=Coemansia helicoidea TaxID=1286919 RepID=A0ACC1L423_9FUNG|nr:Cation-independent mannose-6-phosphate receptor CI-MPR [Coemansia helicoidea]